MIEKWKHALDNSKKIGTIFMDLYKAFDSLNHNLLLLNKIWTKYKQIIHWPFVDLQAIILYQTILIWNVLQSTQLDYKHNRIIKQRNQTGLFPQTNIQLTPLTDNNYTGLLYTWMKEEDYQLFAN